LLNNWDGVSTRYHGVEMALTKRLSNRWMSRVSVGLNDARTHYEPRGLYNGAGNPTGTVAVPLRNGDQLVPVSGGTGAGPIYLNAKWQMNISGLYQAPYGFDVSANVFGRQGYPYPLFRTQTLGSDSNVTVLVTPAIDTFRLPDVWNTDLRIARTLQARRLRVRLIGDLFNVFNANTALVRNNNIAATTFNVLTQNLSPRIFRAGLIVGF
jgi:hypothetical protein